MRVRSIRIQEWRHFENIELKLDDGAGLVCIVGANGTGKSHLLELIAACAHRLGLSHGVEIPRGDPFHDPHSFSLQLSLSTGIGEAIGGLLVEHAALADWDGTLTITSRKPLGTKNITIQAGGIIDAAQATKFATQVVAELKSRRR